MNYEFPVIETLEDILPSIAGRNEFSVRDKDGITFINYDYILPDTFPPVKVAGGSASMRKARSRQNALRRECRGIAFDTHTRKLISRPLHKFFNLNEREETQLNNLDMSKGFTVYEKLDGSMIRPILVDGKIRLATKGGFSDVALQAQEYFDGLPSINHEWILEQLSLERTPIFEWVSPENRIVIRYEYSDLVLLTVRSNLTGNYFMPEEYAPHNPFMVSHGFKITTDFSDYVPVVRNLKKSEGIVGRFDDGHAFKLKADEYVDIHNKKDVIRLDRNILCLMLENQLDDVYPYLDEQDYNRVKQYENTFAKAFDNKLTELTSLAEIISYKSKGDKKTAVMTVMPNANVKEQDKSFILGYMSGDSIFDRMQTFVEKNKHNKQGYEKICEFFDLEVPK